jgi:hypothetical protein
MSLRSSSELSLKRKDISLKQRTTGHLTCYSLVLKIKRKAKNILSFKPQRSRFTTEEIQIKVNLV